MQNKKFLILLSIIVLVLIAVYFLTNKPSATSLSPANSAPVEITNQSPVVSQDKLHKVFSDSGIEKWGFAAINTGICYLGADFSMKFFESASGQTQTILKPNGTFNSAKVVSTSTSCLVEYFTSDKNLLYLYKPGSKPELLALSPTEPILSNLDLYVVATTESKTVLNSDGTTLFEMPDPDRTVFAISPITKDKYFIVDSYERENYVGKLRAVDNAKEKFSADISSALGLFANDKVALSLVQNGNEVDSSLISNTGKSLGSILNVDPNTVVATPTGFYFLTQPGGIVSDRATQNGIGFVSNSGEIRNIISSKDESTEQYNFSALSFVNGSLFASSDDLVYKIAI
jgi:hypothetical protein